MSATERDLPDSEMSTPPRMESARVLLVVPARPEMWSVVRMTASALANRLDFSFEEIEDLRLAVTELCGSTAVGAADDANCECEFELSNSYFEMRCHAGPVLPERMPDVDTDQRLMSRLELSRQILGATVDAYEIDSDSGGAVHGFLRKSRG